MSNSISQQMQAFEQGFAQLSVPVLGQIVLAASDLCLLVSGDKRIVSEVRGGALDALIGQSWVGKDLRSVVCHHVWNKLTLLWSEQSDVGSLWRHLNFIDDDGGPDIPLLVRRIDAGSGHSVLVCRDLRPVVDMQQKFNRAMAEFEQSYEDRNWAQPDQGMGAKATGNDDSTPDIDINQAMKDAISDFGRKPLSDIVAQTGRVLEDLCIRHAFERCEYDLSKTADFLGMSSDELAQRVAFIRK